MHNQGTICYILYQLYVYSAVIGERIMSLI